MRSFSVVGMVLLGTFVVDIPGIGAAEVANFFLSAVGTVLILSVVAADFFLSLLAAAHKQIQEFRGTELEKNLEDRFVALAPAIRPGVDGSGPGPSECR